MTVILKECNTITNELNNELKIKKEALNEAISQNTEIQGELLLLKNEMMVKIDEPQALNVKGNSLFAEVDDK